MSTDKAEFAKFFNFLVHLASKENREDFSVPRDLAPLLKKLETVFSNEDGEVKSISTSKSRHSRRKSHAEGDIAKFPLAEEYPFTFKLMIHKLYDMDEWAMKVKEAVEKSQCQYKPLTDELKSSPKSVERGQSAVLRSSPSQDGFQTRLAPLTKLRAMKAGPDERLLLIQLLHQDLDLDTNHSLLWIRTSVRSNVLHLPKRSQDNLRS